ncbi:MAG: 2-hydroxyacyl-CoA dehydratase family protein [Candidatus Helarchaeota archaeon]
MGVEETAENAEKPPEKKTKKRQILDDLIDAISFTRDIVKQVIPLSDLQILRSFLRWGTPSLIRNLDTRGGTRPVLGHHFVFPPEIFLGYDMSLLAMEVIPYFMSALISFGAEEQYDEMHAYGIPFHTCSAQKGHLGLSYEGRLDLDVVVAPSSPCDNGVGAYQYYSQMANIPLIVTDVPMYQNERAYQYFAKELDAMIRQVGEIIKQDYDFEKVKAAVQNTNESIMLIREINTLRKHVPNPIESMFNPLLIGSQFFMTGQPERPQFYQEVIDIGKRRIKHNDYPGKEDKIRSIWPYMPIFFDFGFCEWMDRQLGIEIILDIFGYYMFDPIEDQSYDGIMRGLSEWSINFPMMRQSVRLAEDYIDDYVRLAKEFKADCAIFTVHIGCKQLISLTQVLREALKDECGIPLLMLDIDVGDKRFVPTNVLKQKMIEFKKTLF